MDSAARRAPHVVAQGEAGAAPDREIGDRGGGVLEIKTVDWLVRARLGREPPPHILLQLQAQLGVTGREWGAVAALVGGNELRIWEYQAFAPHHRRDREARARLLEIDPREPSAAGRWQPQHRRHAGRAVSQRRAPDAGPARRQPGPEACAGYPARPRSRGRRQGEKAHYEAILREKAGDAEAVMVNGFTVRLPAIAAIPDRVAEPGETIRAARATAGSPSAPARAMNESTTAVAMARGQGFTVCCSGASRSSSASAAKRFGSLARPAEATKIFKAILQHRVPVPRSIRSRSGLAADRKGVIDLSEPSA